VDKDEVQNEGTDDVYLFKNAILPKLGIWEVVGARKVLVEAEEYSVGTRTWEFHTQGLPIRELVRACADVDPTDDPAVVGAVGGATNDEAKCAIALPMSPWPNACPDFTQTATLVGAPAACGWSARE
jgi:hypothetical protein